MNQVNNSISTLQHITLGIIIRLKLNSISKIQEHTRLDMMAFSPTVPPAVPPTLIDIGTHKLCLYTHGRAPASSKTPVVLFIPGLSVSQFVWGGVTRFLSVVRSYTYDRSGFGRSELSPLPPTAENIALELVLLLQNAHIHNPLIIVAHSWGGIIAREFIARTRTGDGPHIAGLVLVDANNERTLEELDWTDSNLQNVFAGLDSLGVKGLRTEHKLTPEAWDAFENDEASEKHLLQSTLERNEYKASFETLRKKGLNEGSEPLLGEKPVCVVMGIASRDWERMYKAGIEMGNGTEEERKAARRIIDTADEKNEALQKEHFKLSLDRMMMVASESGHFLQLTEPYTVVNGLLWAIGEHTVHVSSRDNPDE